MRIWASAWTPCLRTQHAGRAGIATRHPSSGTDHTAHKSGGAVEPAHVSSPSARSASSTLYSSHSTRSASTSECSRPRSASSRGGSTQRASAPAHHTPPRPTSSAGPPSARHQARQRVYVQADPTCGPDAKCLARRCRKPGAASAARRDTGATTHTASTVRRRWTRNGYGFAGRSGLARSSATTSPRTWGSLCWDANLLAARSSLWVGASGGLNAVTGRRERTGTRLATGARGALEARAIHAADARAALSLEPSPPSWSHQVADCVTPLHD